MGIVIASRKRFIVAAECSGCRKGLELFEVDIEPSHLSKSEKERAWEELSKSSWARLGEDLIICNACCLAVSESLAIRISVCHECGAFTLNGSTQNCGNCGHETSPVQKLARSGDAIRASGPRALELVSPSVKVAPG